MTGFIHSASSARSGVVRRLILHLRTTWPLLFRASPLIAGRNAANMLFPSLAGAFLARNVYPGKVNDVHG